MVLQSTLSKTIKFSVNDYRTDQSDHAPNWISRHTVFTFIVALVVLTLFLRIAYAGYLFNDDGLWFTAAEELLSGKSLYTAIYLDKPPLIVIVYASLFRVFGTHIIVIRLFMILYSVAISATIYIFGLRLYNRRVGMLAALSFTFFSTISVNSHVQGLNTDFLMLVPYVAGAYLFVRSYLEKRTSLSFFGGILVGIGVQTNPKAIFDLAFLALLLVVEPWFDKSNLPVLSGSRDVKHPPGKWKLMVLALGGVVAGTLPFVVYLYSTNSLSDYWLYVWKWGTGYVAYDSALNGVAHGLWLTLVYSVRNNSLTFGLVYLTTLVIRRLRHTARNEESLDTFDVLRSDVVLLSWFAVSFIALTIGGRFYSNYFFIILPSFCLIGARGLLAMITALKQKNAQLRRAVFALLIISFLITLVRFHTRTFVLASDWMRGAKSEMTAAWYHDQLNHEERVVAETLREVPARDAVTDPGGREDIRVNGPRTRPPGGSSDYLFVWGARAEIYYWSGLLPASRYLIAQPLTGIPGDVQHSANRSSSILDEDVTTRCRAQLIRDLEQTQPRYIVDELGSRNASLSIESYPELKEFLRQYKKVEAIGSFLIYRKDDGSQRTETFSKFKDR